MENNIENMSAYDKIQTIKTFLSNKTDAIEDFSNIDITIDADQDIALDIIDKTIEKMSDNELTALCNEINIAETNADYQIHWQNYQK